MSTVRLLAVISVLAIVAVATPTSRHISSSTLKRNDSPIWLRSFYDAYSTIQREDRSAWTARQVKPNVLAIMTDTTAENPVHHLVQVRPRPAYPTGILQKDPQDHQGISAVLNEKTSSAIASGTPFQSIAAVDANGEPNIILVAVKGKPQNVAAVFLEHGKAPIVIDGVQDKLIPVSLHHIGGELFRVKTEGSNPTQSQFYNLIKAITSTPGIYEVIRDEEEKKSSNSLSDRSLEVQSLNPTQIAQVINAMQGTDRRLPQSLSPTQIAQVIHAVQTDSSGVSSQNINAFQSASKNSLSPSQTAQVIHAIQRNNGGKPLNPKQMAQVIHATQTSDQQSSSQSIHASQESGKDNLEDVSHIGQVIHALQREGGPLNPFRTAQVIHALQGTRPSETAFPSRAAQVLHTVQSSSGGQSLNSGQISQVIKAVQSSFGGSQSIHATQNTNAAGSLNPLYVAQAIHALQHKNGGGLDNNKGVNPLEIVELINLFQESNDGIPLTSSQIAQVIKALEVAKEAKRKDTHGLSPEQIVQLVNAQRPEPERKTPTFAEIAKVLHAVQSAQEKPLESRQIVQLIELLQGRENSEILDSYQVAEIIKTLQTIRRQSLSPVNVAEVLSILRQTNQKKQAVTPEQIAQVLHALQKNRRGQGLNPSQIAEVIKVLQTGNRFGPSRQSINAHQSGSNGKQGIHAVQNSGGLSGQVDQKIHAFQNSNGRYPSLQKIKATQNAAGFGGASQSVSAVQDKKKSSELAHIAQAIHALQTFNGGKRLYPNQIAQVIKAVQAISAGGSDTTQTVNTSQKTAGPTKSDQKTSVKQSSYGSGNNVNQAVHTNQHSSAQGRSLIVNAKK